MKTTEYSCAKCGHSAKTPGYCTECGCAVGDRACSGCGATLGPEARFCSGCGQSIAGSNRGAKLLVFGGSLVLAVSLGWAGAAYLSTDEGGTALETGPAIAAGASPIDIAGMSPRERADRLFDRVMRAAASDDQNEVRQFAPMALDAHLMVGALDADLHFHVATLGLLTGDAELAASHADSILASSPDHIFGLHAAAGAAIEDGDDALARRMYERLLEVYGEESVRDRPEYQLHAPLIPHMRRDAETFLAER